MVGDYHVELVRRRGRVEAFVSDAWRRLVQPRQAWITFDGRETAPLVWKDQRLIGIDSEAARVAEVAVVLGDGTRLVIGFDK